MEALNKVNVVAADADERARLVLTVFELAFLMRGWLYAQRGGDLGAERVRGIEGKEIHGCKLRLRNEI
jgi:hypothetical protein